MDSDDAPELTDAFFEKADKYVDGKLVPREPEDDLTVVYLWARKEAEDEIKALRADNERLREALRNAIDEVETWGGSTSPFLQEKHDLEGVLADLRAELGKGK